MDPSPRMDCRDHHHVLLGYGTDASGTDVPSGVYYCRFTAGAQEGLQKITIMR